LRPFLWALAAVASFGFGLSKTGVPGIGILGVALLAQAFDDNSPGIAVPLLIVGDFVAGYIYYRHAIWSKMLRMFPWAAVGILIGYYEQSLLKARGDNGKSLTHLIGWILIAL